MKRPLRVVTATETEGDEKFTIFGLFQRPTPYSSSLPPRSKQLYGNFPVSLVCDSVSNSHTFCLRYNWLMFKYLTGGLTDGRWNPLAAAVDTRIHPPDRTRPRDRLDAENGHVMCSLRFPAEREASNPRSDYVSEWE